MKNFIQIQGIGYTAEANSKRGILDGKEYDKLFPQVDWKETIVRRNGTVLETVGKIKKVIQDYKNDVREIAPLLKGSTKKETCEGCRSLVLLYDPRPSRSGKVGGSKLMIIPAP